MNDTLVYWGLLFFPLLYLLMSSPHSVPLLLFAPRDRYIVTIVYTTLNQHVLDSILPLNIAKLL